MYRLRYLGTLLGHVWSFAKENRAYWLIPMLVVFGILSALVFLGEASAPFVYTLW
ncbi:MAG: DUF5989 family protein [Myxococcota bacterium]